MGDKYDEAIEELVLSPKAARRLWTAARGHVASPLFQFCTPTGVAKDEENGIPRDCGCLTEIRDGHKVACDERLTIQIRRDERIHKDIDLLTKDLLATDDTDERRRILQPYAEWQRRLDREIRQPAGASS